MPAKHGFEGADQIRTGVSDRSTLEHGFSSSVTHRNIPTSEFRVYLEIGDVGYGPRCRCGRPKTPQATNFRCRCHACRASWAEYVREKNHRLGRNLPWDVAAADRRLAAASKPCGTESKYSYGCRCDLCREAARIARARRRGVTTRLVA